MNLHILSTYSDDDSDVVNVDDDHDDKNNDEDDTLERLLLRSIHKPKAEDYNSF